MLLTKIVSPFTCCATIRAGPGPALSRDPTDQPLSVIATPTHAIRIKRPSAAPNGIDWTRLSPETLRKCHSWPNSQSWPNSRE
jgi:hypothetical protein